MKKIFLTLFILFMAITPINASEDTEDTWEPPVITEWVGKYALDNHLLKMEDTWAYDPFNEEQPYVLFDEEGNIIERSNTYDINKMLKDDMPITIKVDVPDGVETPIEITYSTDFGYAKTVVMFPSNNYEGETTLNYSVQNVHVSTKIDGYSPLYVRRITLYENDNHQYIRYVNNKYVDSDNIEFIDDKPLDENQSGGNSMPNNQTTSSNAEITTPNSTPNGLSGTNINQKEQFEKKEKDKIQTVIPYVVIGFGILTTLFILKKLDQKRR